MLGIWIKNSLTTASKRKLMDFNYSYTFNSETDVAKMSFVILKMVRPDTRSEWSDIKSKLENMKMSHFKYEIPKSNLQIAEWMNEILN